MKAEQYPVILRSLAGLGLVSLLAGCANGPSWGGWSQRPTDAEVAAVIARVEAQQIAQQPAPEPVLRQEPIAVVAASNR